MFVSIGVWEDCRGRNKQHSDLLSLVPIITQKLFHVKVNDRDWTKLLSGPSKNIRNNDLIDTAHQALKNSNL